MGFNIGTLLAYLKYGGGNLAVAVIREYLLKILATDFTGINEDDVV